VHHTPLVQAVGGRQCHEWLHARSTAIEALPDHWQPPSTHLRFRMLLPVKLRVA